ncbi:MAG TPA: hypothetical protein VGP64_04530 [Polyangia bacterium]|jgi:hypothetical protein
MRSVQALAVGASLLGLVLTGTACFRPGNLTGFSCGDGGAGNGICPDGLTCDRRNNTCVSSIKDAGAGGTTGTGGAAGKGGQGGKGGMGGTGTGGMNGTGGVDAGPCLDQIASCQPSDAGMCDPVCNTGCTADCHDKCSVNSNGDLTCNVPTKTAMPGLLGACDQSSFGAAQTDNCQPGQVCVMPNSCGTRCYQFCRGDSDCANGASCSLDAGGGYKMCDVPSVACDPVNGGTAKSSCGGGNSLIGCYLSATSTATLCDCQNNRAAGTGNGSPSDPCTRSRDCFAGLVCYDATSRGNKQCRKVCRLPNADGGIDAQPGEVGCTVASDCSPILLPNGTTNPTFGFCNE